MGVAYQKALRTSVSTVWITLPKLVRFADPTLFIPAVCTLGGACIGLLAVNLQSVTMPDFIGKQRSQDGSSKRRDTRTIEPWIVHPQS